MTDDDVLAMNGRRVTAKRIGWNDPEDPILELDRTPYAEQGHASPDLSGELNAYRWSGGVGCLVGGQEADPKTVRPV